MSTIVAVRKSGRTVVAWETLTCVGSSTSSELLPAEKVLRWGENLIGTAGLTVYYAILEHYFGRLEPVTIRSRLDVFDLFLNFWRELHNSYHFVNDQAESDDRTGYADLGAEFILVNHSGIFRIREILSVDLCERFCAIGSGSSYAEAAAFALFDRVDGAEEIALNAVRVASEFDRASGGAVRHILLEP